MHLLVKRTTKVKINWWNINQQKVIFKHSSSLISSIKREILKSLKEFPWQSQDLNLKLLGFETNALPNELSMLS